MSRIGNWQFPHAWPPVPPEYQKQCKPFQTEEVYDKLVKSIYNNKDIARIVLDGYSNGGFSFLLMSLWNPTLKLTEEQKQFAVSEAMNKIGTVKYL